MFKIIIFDLVGVFSEHKNVYSIFKKITRYKDTANSLKAYLGDSYDKLITGAVSELIFWNKLKKITGSRKSIDTLKKSFFSNFKPVFKAEEYNRIRHNFKVALCSNFVNSWWLYLKDKFKLDFDFVVLSSSLKIKKPEKGIYLTVPAFFKTSPENCVYVSDEVEDIRTAKSLGMQTIFIPGMSKTCKEADYTYKTLSELLEVLS